MSVALVKKKHLSIAFDCARRKPNEACDNRSSDESDTIEYQAEETMLYICET